MLETVDQDVSVYFLTFCECTKFLCWNNPFDTGNQKDPNCCPSFIKKFCSYRIAEHSHNPLILLAPRSYHLEF